MRWLGTVATSSTLFVLQLFLCTTISDPEPTHKPLNNSAALFPEPNPPHPAFALGALGWELIPNISPAFGTQLQG